MRIHPQIGAEIIASVRSLYPVAPIILGHHERWDGTGYPQALWGDAIPSALAFRASSTTSTSSRPSVRFTLPCRYGADAAASRSGPRTRPCSGRHLHRQAAGLGGGVRRSRCRRPQQMRPLQARKSRPHRTAVVTPSKTSRSHTRGDLHAVRDRADHGHYAWRVGHDDHGSSKLDHHPVVRLRVVHPGTRHKRRPLPLCDGRRGHIPARREGRHWCRTFRLGGRAPADARQRRPAHRVRAAGLDGAIPDALGDCLSRCSWASASSEPWRSSTASACYTDGTAACWLGSPNRPLSSTTRSCSSTHGKSR